MPRLCSPRVFILSDFQQPWAVHFIEGETEASRGGHFCADSLSICAGASYRTRALLFLILLYLHFPARVGKAHGLGSQ